MRLGIGFTGSPFSVGEIVEYAKMSERAGIDSLWVAEDYFLRDAVSILSSVALSTEKIKLATGIISPYVRNPVLIALTTATLDEASKGRMILGLGTGAFSPMGKMGITFKKPLTFMRESVEVIRRLLEGEEVNFQGEFLTVKGVKLGRSPYFTLLRPFRPVRRRIPIYLAAKGPKMLQLAGEIGDGVLLTAGCSREYVKYAVEKVKAGAEKAGRSLEEVDVASYILYSPYRFEDVNLALKALITHIISRASPSDLKRDGINEDESRRLRETLEKEGVRESLRLLTEEMAEKYSVFGDVERCREKVLEYVESGVTLPILMSFDRDMPRVIRTLRELSEE